MSKTFDTIIRNATIQTHEKSGISDVGVKDGLVERIGDMSQSDAGEVIDAKGLHLLPGVIDTQVHFREPGNEHKEDLASGSLAAVAGGVTALFEMPNTNPLTSNPEALADKVSRAKGRMFCDHAFYVGATAENARELGDLEMLPGACGVKVFMGASTGNLLVKDDETLREVLSHGKRRVAIHAEDEYRMNEREGLREEGRPHSHPIWRDAQSALIATKRVVTIAREVGRPVHVLHITTTDEMAYLKENKDVASVETTPQHLTLFAPDCYDRLGTYAQMNPPIRDKYHNEGVWKGLQDGTVDVIGSDHAPHTKEEKAQTYPSSPSGMPGVQTLFPLMLHHMLEGRLSFERLVDLTSFGARRLFNLKDRGLLREGFKADFTLCDINSSHLIENQWLKSKCGWSPFEGMNLKGRVKGTIISGQKVMWEDDILGAPAGEPIQFE